MKIVALIDRVLLGLMFVVFGSNMFFNFIPTPPLPPGPLKDFTTVLFTTHFIWVVGFFQVLPGLLLLIGRYVPLAVAMLAPVLVNIFATHIFVAHAGLFPMPVVVALLWAYLFWYYRASFAPLFRANA